MWCFLVFVSSGLQYLAQWVMFGRGRGRVSQLFVRDQLTLHSSSWYVPYYSNISPTTAVESLKTKGRLRFHSPPPAQRAPLSRHAAISARELLSTVRPHLHLTLHLPCFLPSQRPLAQCTREDEISLHYMRIC